MIRNNKKIVDSPNEKCKNCLELVIQKIDPMYLYADCNQDNRVSAEELWKSMGNLKRTILNKYNMYACKLDNGNYRTSAVNDFVLKGIDNKGDGKMTKEQFRMAVLMGYWDRQTDNSQIFLNDARNLKATRWSEAGVVDTMCTRIQQSIEKARK